MTLINKNLLVYPINWEPLMQSLQILACFLSSRLSKSQSVSSLEKFSESNTAPGPLSGLHVYCSFWSLGCLLLNVVAHSIIKWSEKMDSALVWLCRNCGLFENSRSNMFPLRCVDCVINWNRKILGQSLQGHLSSVFFIKFLWHSPECPF